MASVPIIDIGDLRSPDLSKRQRVADDLGNACETIGFLSVVNHGISQDVVGAAFEQMKRVFALPDEVKLAAAGRGYITVLRRGGPHRLGCCHCPCPRRLRKSGSA